MRTHLEYVKPPTDYTRVKGPGAHALAEGESGLAYIVELEVSPPADKQNTYSGHVTLWIDAHNGQLIGGDATM